MHLCSECINNTWTQLGQVAGVLVLLDISGGQTAEFEPPLCLCTQTLCPALFTAPTTQSQTWKGEAHSRVSRSVAFSFRRKVSPLNMAAILSPAYPPHHPSPQSPVPQSVRAQSFYGLASPLWAGMHLVWSHAHQGWVVSLETEVGYLAALWPHKKRGGGKKSWWRLLKVLASFSYLWLCLCQRRGSRGIAH